MGSPIGQSSDQSSTRWSTEIFGILHGPPRLFLWKQLDMKVSEKMRQSLNRRDKKIKAIASNAKIDRDIEAVIENTDITVNDLIVGINMPNYEAPFHIFFGT